MKGMQYTITRLDNGLQAQWGKDTILFDTQEEAEEMMNLFPNFFNPPKNLEIKKGIYYIDNSINYKDLKEREDFKKGLEENKMGKTLQEVLNTDLSPDKMGNFTPNELADFLVKSGIVDNATDVNRIVIEGIQRALNEDDEFPIKYYSKEEDMPEESKIIENPGEMLTDELVHAMKGTNLS